MEWDTAIPTWGPLRELREHADFNTFVGFGAGMDNNRTNNDTTANRNTYVGAWAGQTNREGQDNVVIGAHADMANQDESDAILACQEGVGWQDGFIDTTSGDNNVSRVVNIGTSGIVKGDDAIGVGYAVTSNGNRGIAMGSGASSTHAEAVAIGYGLRVDPPPTGDPRKCQYHILGTGRRWSHLIGLTRLSFQRSVRRGCDDQADASQDAVCPSCKWSTFRG